MADLCDGTSSLCAAHTRILSYIEAGDLMAIDAAIRDGFPILRRIAKNNADHRIEHRVVFGFSYQNASALVDFLKRHHHHLRHVTGVRDSGELEQPFHVVDDGQSRRRLPAAVAQGDEKPAGDPCRPTSLQLMGPVSPESA
jgi:hypothetical protein